MGAAMKARSLSKNWVVDHDAIHLGKIHSLGAARRYTKMLISFAYFKRGPGES